MNTLEHLTNWQITPMQNICDPNGRVLLTSQANFGYEETAGIVKLAASAPDLLEALTNLVNAVPNDGTWNYQAACDKARQIINKATK